MLTVRSRISGDTDALVTFRETIYLMILPMTSHLLRSSTGLCCKKHPCKINFVVIRASGGEGWGGRLFRNAFRELDCIALHLSLVTMLRPDADLSCLVVVAYYILHKLIVFNVPTLCIQWHICKYT